MSPLRILLLALLAGVLAFPAAGANFHVEGGTPVPGALPANPQAFCLFILQDGGGAECTRDVRVTGATAIRVRTEGTVSVYASAYGASLLAFTNCYRLVSVSCKGEFPAPYTGTVRLTARAYDALPGAVAYVDVETDPARGTPI